jgi:hypothetical protein
MSRYSEEVARLLNDKHEVIARLMQLESNAKAAAELDQDQSRRKVPFMPKFWEGPDYKDARLVDCPAKFLFVLADAFAFTAKGKTVESLKNPDNEDMRKKALYGRLDAGRCLAIARAKEASELAGAGATVADDGIPF